jgi:hypothetical protein
VGELSEIAYMAVSAMNINFIGFFLDGSKITNEGIFGHKVQKLEFLKEVQPCLLLLTVEFSMDKICDKGLNNVDTLNLLNYY